jgi:hypothetical protein
MGNLRLDDWRDRIASFRDSGLALLLLLLVILCAIMAVFTRPPDYGQERHEGTPVLAKITRIGASGSKYRPYLRTVTIQDDSGVDHYLTEPVDMIAGCKIGDSVKAIRSGPDFTLQPMTCRKAG